MVKAIHAEQGEILELQGRVRYVLVLSRDLFNRTGMSIVCPVVENTFEDALHIPVQTGGFTETVVRSITCRFRMLQMQSRRSLIIILTNDYFAGRAG